MLSPQISLLVPGPTPAIFHIPEKVAFLSTHQGQLSLYLATSHGPGATLELSTWDMCLAH